jgi:hypothetical protein
MRLRKLAAEHYGDKLITSLGIELRHTRRNRYGDLAEVLPSSSSLTGSYLHPPQCHQQKQPVQVAEQVAAVAFCTLLSLCAAELNRL